MVLIVELVLRRMFSVLNLIVMQKSFIFFLLLFPIVLHTTNNTQHKSVKHKQKR